VTSSQALFRIFGLKEASLLDNDTLHAESGAAFRKAELICRDLCVLHKVDPDESIVSNRTFENLSPVLLELTEDVFGAERPRDQQWFLQRFTSLARPSNLLLAIFGATVSRILADEKCNTVSSVGKQWQLSELLHSAIRTMHSTSELYLRL